MLRLSLQMVFFISAEEYGRIGYNAAVSNS